MRKIKVIILINDTTYAYILRGALIKKLILEEYEVIVVGQFLDHVEKLRSMGCKLVESKTDRHGMNPLSDLMLQRFYMKVLKIEKPDIVLSYNIKPNVYGGLSCQNLGIPFIANITGLGTPLEKRSKLQKLAIQLYKFGIKGANCIFFQNYDNKQFFINNRMLKDGANVQVLPGSGVDLYEHPLLSWPEEPPIHFLFAARIMKEKGIDLFLAVARRFSSKNIIFDVCGQCDDEKYFDIFHKENSVTYHGFQSDLTSFYNQSSCFLYPSYYPEGMSNVLLEAAASGRPLIATDRPGCKETIDDGKTGFIIPANNEFALLKAVEKFLNMSPQERKKMGLAGRKKMEQEFDRQIVVNAYMKCIREITEHIGKNS